jgi:hypothetical protein
MDRRKFLQGSVAAHAAAMLHSPSHVMVASSVIGDREYWVDLLLRIARPVLEALSQQKLKQWMPVEAPHGNAEERRHFTYLEAMGRLFSGIAPWLESGPSAGKEGLLRMKYAELARQAMDAATDPASPDFMNFSKGQQPLVDAAFLSLAIVRAPIELWQKLDARVQHNVIAALQSTRKMLTYYSNWLVFPAMIEAALSLMTDEWDPTRVDYAIRTVNTWYKGDGVYGDGPDFRFDYYNSFVIQPMILNILNTLSKVTKTWDSFKPEMTMRAVRYAVIEERLIGPDGSFPPVGRSLCYRFGAFHLLAEIALCRQLPKEISPSQVRAALTAVMRRVTDAPGTFDGEGWLRVGLCGYQPDLAENYISTGSCYLCAAAWLPLGLPITDSFWTDEAKPWTSKKAWNGGSISPDHAIHS